MTTTILTSPDFNPRLYVGTYAKYNNGSIAGEWLDPADYTDSESFYDACIELHSDEDDPELMFQDFEGFPRDMYSESGGLDELYELIEFIESSHLDYEVIQAGLDLDIPLENIEDAYHGEFDNDEDFAYQLADDCGSIDHEAVWPQNCIDWVRAASELMYDYNESNGHYFSANW